MNVKMLTKAFILSQLCLIVYLITFSFDIMNNNNKHYQGPAT